MAVAAWAARCAAQCSSRHTRRHVASGLRVGETTLPPLQVFAPGGSAGGTARSPAGPRVTARPVSEGWTRSACRAWGRCRRAGSCPSARSSPSPAQWPRRAGPRGTRVGERRQVPRCQLHGSQRCGLCLPPDLQVQQAQTRQAAPRATPGPVTAASGRRREASAPAAAPPPVHGARADVGGGSHSSRELFSSQG